LVENAVIDDPNGRVDVDVRHAHEVGHHLEQFPGEETRKSIFGFSAEIIYMRAREKIAGNG